ncbi:MAG: hypothetical protein Q9201_000102 [Fulgogasparrea decipioides]
MATPDESVVMQPRYQMPPTSMVLIPFIFNDRALIPIVFSKKALVPFRWFNARLQRTIANMKLETMGRAIEDRQRNVNEKIKELQHGRITADKKIEELQHGQSTADRKIKKLQHTQRLVHVQDMLKNGFADRRIR